MKVFVTGGSGFIGRHFLEELLRRNVNVCALRRRASPSYHLDGIEWIDVPMDELSKADFDGVDVIVNLAAVGISPRVASMEEMNYWNVLVPSEMAIVAAESGVSKYISAGSFAEYGKSADEYDYLHRSAPLLPTSKYAASKAAVYMNLCAIDAQTSMEVLHARLFSVYGEGQNAKNFFPSLCLAARNGEDFEMSSGSQIRDFISVEKVSSKLCDLVMGLHTPLGNCIAINVGEGIGQTVLSFAEHWWEKLGAKGKLLPGRIPDRPDEPRRYVALIEDN